MKMNRSLRLTCAAIAVAAAGTAQAVSVPLEKLSGLVGDSEAALTAVYRANLSLAGIGSFLALSIADVSGGFGGSPGAFTGFDLDAIKLSTVECATAACASTAPGLSLFDFVSGVVFAPGTQRPPLASKLFGTGAGGGTLDDGVATLGSFDAHATTGAQADGFLSLGDNGSIGFNLTSLVSTSGLYLYLGEVGDNGEVAGSNVDLRTSPIPAIPEPETYALMLAGLGLLGVAAKKRKAARPPV